MSKKTTLRQSVFGLVLDEERQAFVQIQTPNNSVHRGRFHLPGGKLEKGERPSEALVRELDEELSLQREEMVSIDWIYTHKARRGGEMWQEHFFVVIVRDEAVERLKGKVGNFFVLNPGVTWHDIESIRSDSTVRAEDSGSLFYTGAYLTGVTLFRYVDELFNSPAKSENYSVEKAYRDVLKCMRDYPHSIETGQMGSAVANLDKVIAATWRGGFSDEVGARSMVLKVEVLMEMDHSYQTRDRLRRELVDLGRVLQARVYATQT